MMGTMKKIAALISLLCVCSLASADSLERLVNQYKEKDGAVCRVLNRDYHFNDISGEDMSIDAQRLVGCMMALMGVEEWTTLKLERCKESIRERFVDKVIDAVPDDYALLIERGYCSVYVNNAEEEYAYLVVADCDILEPSLTRLYVTNAFMRAIMNDEGTGIDEENLFHKNTSQFGIFAETEPFSTVQTPAETQAAKSPGKGIGGKDHGDIGDKADHQGDISDAQQTPAG